MNPYLELHQSARLSNDWLAVHDATMARDLWRRDPVTAAWHGKLCRERLNRLAANAACADLTQRVRELSAA